MAKINAQRQAEYRARRRCNHNITRLNMEVSHRAQFALDRLAYHHGLTLRHMLERLITESHDALCKTLDGAVVQRYIDKAPTTNSNEVTP